jgi:type III restriction enzyme
MATGSGKTYAMALIIVWSYFNRIIESNLRYPDNFLIIAPNVVVYERLAKDFADNKIFYSLPLIPPAWKHRWALKVTLRGDDSPLNPSGNIIVNNIQQLYASRKLNESTEKDNIVHEISRTANRQNKKTQQPNGDQRRSPPCPRRSPAMA